MKQHKTNIVLHCGIAESGLRNWEAAEIIGFSESYFSRMIRTELPFEKQLEMLEKIREGVKKNGNDENN